MLFSSSPAASSCRMHGHAAPPFASRGAGALAAESASTVVVETGQGSSASMGQRAPKNSSHCSPRSRAEFRSAELVIGVRKFAETPKSWARIWHRHRWRSRSTAQAARAAVVSTRGIPTDATSPPAQPRLEAARASENNSRRPGLEPARKREAEGGCGKLDRCMSGTRPGS